MYLKMVETRWKLYMSWGKSSLLTSRRFKGFVVRLNGLTAYLFHPVFSFHTSQRIHFVRVPVYDYIFTMLHCCIRRVSNITRLLPFWHELWVSQADGVYSSILLRITRQSKSTAQIADTYPANFHPDRAVPRRLAFECEWSQEYRENTRCWARKYDGWNKTVLGHRVWLEGNRMSRRQILEVSLWSNHRACSWLYDVVNHDQLCTFNMIRLDPFVPQY
jgi:hypothetical protein